MSDKYIKFIIEKYAFTRFMIVGCICTSLDFTIYMICSTFTDTAIAKTVSMVCSISVNYRLNKSWSFSSSNKKVSTTLIKYIPTQCINLIINVGVNAVVFYCTRMRIFSYIIATVAAMIANYTLQKKWVFK